MFTVWCVWCIGSLVSLFAFMCCISWHSQNEEVRADDLVYVIMTAFVAAAAGWYLGKCLALAFKKHVAGETRG